MTRAEEELGDLDKARFTFAVRRYTPASRKYRGRSPSRAFPLGETGSLHFGELKPKT